jgi:hypothetical protein
MPIILRDFLFLDTQVLTDYLAALEGYVNEGTIEETEKEQKDAGGKFDLKAVGGEGKVSGSKETKRKLAITDAAQFQTLYEILEEQEALMFLDAFDVSIWNQIKRGEILEIQANIRLPKNLLMIMDVENWSPLLDIMRIAGQEPLADNQARTAYEGMRAVGQSIADKPIPIIFEAVSTPGLTFLTHLNKKHLRREANELHGEATVFGKVQRIVPKGQKVEAFSLLPTITGNNSLNRQQRRKMEKSADMSKVIEEVKGPAIILTTVAVYR